jgi:hypothetical protein
MQHILGTGPSSCPPGPGNLYRLLFPLVGTVQNFTHIVLFIQDNVAQCRGQ